MQSTLVAEDESVPPFAWVVGAITMFAGLLLAASAFAATPKQTSQINPALCQMLVKHTPDADVAYQPGIDAEGHKVTPADLPGQAQMRIPDKIQIPLTLSLSQTLGLNTATYPNNQLGQQTEPVLGTFVVEGDHVSFNGQDLSDAQQEKLAVLCLHPQ